MGYQNRRKLTRFAIGGLFASSSSEERKYWGFLLFIKVLNEAPLQQVNLVFTKNLVRSLTNQLAVEARYLHNMAVKAAKSIQSRVSRDPEFAACAVSGLMGPSGAINFDQITKTKTIEKIVMEANTDALNTIVSILEKLIQAPGTVNVKISASNRHVLAGLLMVIVRALGAEAKRGPTESSWDILERILLIFLRFGYFTDKDADKPIAQPALTEATQELFRSRINSCLNIFIANRDYADLPYIMVRKIHEAVKSKEFGKCVVSMDGTVRQSVKTAFKSLKQLSKYVGPFSVLPFA